jgi:hypothetical protein
MGHANERFFLDDQRQSPPAIISIHYNFGIRTQVVSLAAAMKND